MQFVVIPSDGDVVPSLSTLAQNQHGGLYQVTRVMLSFFKWVAPRKPMYVNFSEHFDTEIEDLIMCQTNFSTTLPPTSNHLATQIFSFMRWSELSVRQKTPCGANDCGWDYYSIPHNVSFHHNFSHNLLL